MQKPKTKTKQNKKKCFFDYYLQEIFYLVNKFFVRSPRPPPPLFISSSAAIEL